MFNSKEVDNMQLLSDNYIGCFLMLEFIHVSHEGAWFSIKPTKAPVNNSLQRQICCMPLYLIIFCVCSPNMFLPLALFSCFPFSVMLLWLTIWKCYAFEYLVIGLVGFYSTTWNSIICFSANIRIPDWLYELKNPSYSWAWS